MAGSGTGRGRERVAAGDGGATISQGTWGTALREHEKLLAQFVRRKIGDPVDRLDLVDACSIERAVRPPTHASSDCVRSTTSFQGPLNRAPSDSLGASNLLLYWLYATSGTRRMPTVFMRK